MIHRRPFIKLSALVATSVCAMTACGSTAVAPSGNGGQSGVPGGPTASADPGKSLDNFDPCSVVSDSEYVQAITAEAADPSAMDPITATHEQVDGSATGLPGAKACQLSYTTTDSSGRVSRGGDPVIVTFDKYSNLAEIQGTHPVVNNDYQASGASAFIGPGDGGIPHITKNGYLFRLSGNSDTKLLKVIALGIAGRL